MLYFSGSGIQIFSLGMIFMLLTSPITAVLNIFNGTSEPPFPHRSPAPRHAGLKGHCVQVADASSVRGVQTHFSGGQ